MKEDIYNMRPEQMMSLYLMASYGYYIIGRSLLEDYEYDYLAKTLLEKWQGFEHIHKHLVNEDDLRAGTLFALKAEDYPSMVVGGYECWLDSLIDECK